MLRGQRAGICAVWISIRVKLFSADNDCFKHAAPVQPVRALSLKQALGTISLHHTLAGPDSPQSDWLQSFKAHLSSIVFRAISSSLLPALS